MGTAGLTGVVAQVGGHGGDKAGLAQQLLQDGGERVAVVAPALPRGALSGPRAARRVDVAGQDLGGRDRARSEGQTHLLCSVRAGHALTPCRQHAIQDIYNTLIASYSTFIRHSYIVITHSYTVITQSYIVIAHS